VLSVLAILAVAREAPAQEVDLDAIAENLVKQSAEVRPGEVVVISGNPEQTELMGAIQVAVSKAGGQSILTLNLPEANRRAVLETPMEYLEQLPTAGLLLGKVADVFINVTSVQDPELFADVPEERLAAAREAAAPLNTAFLASAVRNVTLGQTGGIPTVAYAESMGADHGELSGIFWRAVSVPPQDLAEQGRQMAKQLAPGSRVHLTSEAGSDLTFEIDRLQARINAGRTADVVTGSGPASVWLPAGEAYACVKSDSATGTLVIPQTTFRGKPVENLRMQFEAGKLQELTADSGAELMKEFLQASSDATKTISLVDVGLNPHSRPPAESRYLSWEMGGMVTVGLGNNAWAGGDNDAEGALTFHVPEASLSVDGKNLVSGGELE
jgi:aminopeptidase